ncbi:MAG: Ribosomal RNA large subunit methyltransferase J [Pseudidiomarina mangrovi]|nr:MAG: Ribosomal RNA large subunit methyltransferase J [Pseudidiomarina mangrovi]
MNYRHSYHAGNFADVVKHALQCMCLAYLRQKDKPFWVLDTHAGIGMYDLLGEQASKTGEWQQGIAKLLAAENIPVLLQDYVNAVRSLNSAHELRWYPGSPWLTAQQLRSQDALTLCELHPIDSQLLRDNVSQFHSAGSVKVLPQTNGYSAIKALLPPPIKRGMVLIDPPFEQRDEFDTVVQALSAGMRRWATATYVVWYPIKDPLSVGEFHQQVAAIQGVEKLFAADVLVRSALDRTKLNGCGMLFVNPPYGVTSQAAEVLAFLTPLLAQDRGAQWQAQWLKGE